MNALVWIDWLCLGLLIISVLLGLMRGLLSEALGLAGWLVALVAARQFGAEAGGLLDEVILSPGIRTAVGFVLVVLGTVLVWGLMLRLLERLVQAVGMGGFNRLLGGVFGALRAAVILVLVTAVVGLTPLRDSADWQAAQLRPTLEQLRDWSLARYREWDTGGDWQLPQDGTAPSSQTAGFQQQASGLLERARHEGRTLSEGVSQQVAEQFMRQQHQQRDGDTAAP